jgi:hypothetical protein
MIKIWQMPLVAIVFCCALVDYAIANPMSQTENFFDRPSGDYHSYSSGSFAQCATSCATVAKCRAYTFVISTGICWMKDSVPNRVANNCCISGVKVMGAMEAGFDRPGSDIRPGFDTSSPDSCENACRLDSACRAYTFVKPNIQGPSAKCWLKNARPNKVGNSCCVSGVRLKVLRVISPTVPRPKPAIE